MIRGRLLAAAIAAAVAAGVIAVVIVMNPVPPLDVTVDRDIQATNWGPLTLLFPIYSWIGDAKGAVVDAAVFIAVLIWNRRAWILAIAGYLTGLWYVIVSHLVNRPRPTTALVLRVTEHPSASSFPSGHTIFIATVTSILMLCLGHRYLPRWALPIGWLVVAAIVFDGAISRIYTGAHWPTDVLAGLLIAIAWLSLVLSIRWISDRAFGSKHGEGSSAGHAS
ncbi:MAG: phosphatase PAP2 family protein [Candidatus Dormibacteraeota bacterium]|nr:phosphatase PAP2 family protein [Candidatus Dormibacteraeota bacterium]